MKKIIVILGMHRSGTSVLTNLLLELGYNLGNNLMPPTNDNPKGYFEDLDLVSLNEEILSYMGVTWKDYKTIKSKTLETLLYEKFSEKAFKLIKNLIATSNHPTAIKDPRLSILLFFWDRIFKKLDLDIQYIHMVRNPMEVAMSMEKRDGIRIEEGFLIWKYYNLSIINDLNQEALLLNYEDLINEPKETLVKICNFLSKEYKDILYVVENKLRRNTSKISEYIFEVELLEKRFEETFGKPYNPKLLLKEEKFKFLAEYDFIQIYFENMGEFSEEKSYKIKFEDEPLVKGSIKFDKNILTKKIRFDPGSISCIIKSIKVLLKDENGKKIDYKTSNNGTVVEGNLLFFEFRDPQINFKSLGGNIHEVIYEFERIVDEKFLIKVNNKYQLNKKEEKRKIEMDLKKEKEEKRKIEMDLKKEKEEKRKIEMDLKKENIRRSKELEKVKEELEKEINKIDIIKNSMSWKITKPLRKIKGLVK